MNKDKLTAEIGHELRQLSLLAEHAGELSQVPERERRPWHAAAAAKYAADLANGLENLCKRRYRAMGQSVPEGEDSHTRILDAFLDEPNLGGGLSDEEKHRLRKYLRFRHRFVHGYGHEVRWEIVDEPLRLLPETVATLCRIWSCWIEDTVRPR
jgi:uncharacterized protein YutE (UPF0331/DUF86 family)